MKPAFSSRLALAVWLVVMALCAAVIARTQFVADLSAFMPKAPTPRQQMLLDQLRDGAIARLVLLGIEGGGAAERARLSRELAAALAQSPRFSSVQNGGAESLGNDLRYFFEQRYLLSPAVDHDRFSSAGLRAAIQTSLDALSGDGGLLVKRALPRDPTGESLLMLEQFIGEARPRSEHDVWVSRDARRAVLMLQIRESGLDTDAQAAALADIQQRFASLQRQSPDIRLIMSGTSVMAVASRDTIEGEVGRLALLGTLLVVSLLLLIYRSLPLLLLGLLPVATGAVAGIACVSLGFGHVHGLTLGFGTTLIGEAVDYSIYYFLQRGDGDQTAFWRTIRLGVMTSITGFAALLCSSFPGLSQIGLYSISGLIAAVLTTRFVLPGLTGARTGVRDLRQTGARLQQVFLAASRLRWLVGVLALAAVGVLLARHDDMWNRQLTALSPVSKAQGELDASLRADLGGADMRYVASFTAPDQELALVLAERAAVVLRQLMDQQRIGGFHSPAQLLPSLASQRARQAALPAADELGQRLQIALAGLPLRSDKLAGFLRDVDHARSAPLLDRSALAGTSVAVLLDSMLIRRASDYLVLMPLRASETAADGLINVEQVDQALRQAGLSQVVAIDLLEETTLVFERYMHEALLLAGLGCLAIVLLLAATCRPVPALQIAVPLACAVAVTAALLLLGGIRLNILHLVGLLLVVAVGSNYALFFIASSPGGQSGKTARPDWPVIEEQGRDQGGAARPSAVSLASTDSSRSGQVEVSLLIANVSTVVSFGVLGMSRVPVLAAIGSTVATGAFLALLFSAMLARPARHAPLS